MSATDLIATWKERFPDFWPEGNRFYGPLTGIAPGEVALLNMSLPGKLKPVSYTHLTLPTTPYV